MDDKLLCMHKNMLQLRNLNYCKIVNRYRYGFSAELLLRQGKYKIRVDYYAYGWPRIYVLEPDIDMSHPVEIHTFGKKYHGAYKREIPLLCLTFHDIDKWEPSMMLLKSYIPWAVEWTEFYEIWLMTGVWYGGGIHPTNNDEKGRNS